MRVYEYLTELGAIRDDVEMKKIMIIFLLLISNLTNAEVFTIVGNANLRGTVLTLVAGERYVNKQALRKHSSTSDWTDDYIAGYVTFGDALM